MQTQRLMSGASGNHVTGTESRTHDLLTGGVAPAVPSSNDYCSTSSFNRLLGLPVATVGH